MQYFGEHLWPGQLGHLLVVLSFVATLVSGIAYFVATQRRQTPEAGGWQNIGRGAFAIHGLATLGVIGVLFYILVNKYYEYHYAWANISDDLPVQYVFSAFWKEQQGSFLLWSFWHIGLALVLIWKAGRWEAPVMTFIALAEVFISSMILGLYFGDARFGASPFDLLRDTIAAPIFSQPDYLSKVQGNGLNPLLQNYWMTIHPPTLFLGFASTIVPFAFAMAGLWTGEHKAWLKPALPWALFSGAILGTGILMGGAWAYEALSFAGYWAWDPVENTSLVPWIILVAGIHTNLIAKNTGYSIRSTYAYYILTFVLILYSTYLTRSGILGDTSAHAFTEMGLGIQLIAFILAFASIGLWAWIRRYPEVTEKKKEESSTSREFWMFIGSLVLLFSAVLITGATSLPVFNKIVKLFNDAYQGAALENPIEHHNRYQMWIAVFIALLSGIGQFMRYNERNWAGYRRKFLLHMGISVAGAIGLTLLNRAWISVYAWQLYVMLFAAMFTISANADYLISVIKGNLKLAGSAVSHLGFGVLLLGIMSTGIDKTWISSNKFVMEGLIEGMGANGQDKNVMLPKGLNMPIKNGYEVTYERDTVIRQTRSFQVRFKRRDKAGNYTKEEFVLYPNVMYDRAFSKVVASNPSTKHFFDHDIFTHVTALPKGELDAEFARQQEDSLQFKPFSARFGDTITLSNCMLVLEGITKQPKHKDYTFEEGDLAFGLQLRAFSPDFPQGQMAEPMVYFRPGKGGFSLPVNFPKYELKVRLTENTFNKIMNLEDSLRFSTFKVKIGESFPFQGYSVTLKGLSQQVEHPNYQPMEGDLAVAAQLEIRSGATAAQTHQAGPVYLIRDKQPFSLKDEIHALGLHIRFENIDPATGLMTIGIAQAGEEQQLLPLQIAENAPRTEYIVLEAIVFPGINLVWLGSILMLIGMGLGLWQKFRK